MGRSTSFLILFSLALIARTPTRAAGHGPLWGLATPVNSKGSWSLDLGAMGRTTSGPTSWMARVMAAYGLTRDLQLSLSVWTHCGVGCGTPASPPAQSR